MPLVSVLMTTYNREAYISKAIESVLASSYSNFELIVVDDASTDSTVAVANEYIRNDNRIKVYVNPINMGDYQNRNIAAGYAKGKYLKYVDSDDIIYPWGLELLVTMMEQFPDAGWGICTLAQHDTKPYPFMLNPKEIYTYNYTESNIFLKSPLSSIIKKDCFNSVAGFRPIRMAGDFDMWHRLANHFPVVLMPDGIVWNRVHGNQEMNHYNDFVQVYEKLRIEHLLSKECPLDPKLCSMLIKKQRNKILRAVIRNILYLDFKSLALQFKRLKPYKKIGKV